MSASANNQSKLVDKLASHWDFDRLYKKLLDKIETSVTKTDDFSFSEVFFNASEVMERIRKKLEDEEGFTVDLAPVAGQESVVRLRVSGWHKARFGVAPAEIPAYMGPAGLSIEDSRNDWVRELRRIANEKNSAGDPSLYLGHLISPTASRVDSPFSKSGSMVTSFAHNMNILLVGQTYSGKTNSLKSFVAAGALMHPDSEWLFADGKGTNDLDRLASRLSVYPVAKPVGGGQGTTLAFDRLVAHAWDEVTRRKCLFEETKHAEGPIVTATQYSAVVAPLPTLWLVMDEPSTFLSAARFEDSWRRPGTTAHRLSSLMREGCSYGVRVVIATSRYQASDLPMVLRSSLTARLTHSVPSIDANFLDTPKATTLKVGEYFLSAAGLYDETSRTSHFLCAMPHLGEAPDETLDLLLSHIKPKEQREFSAEAAEPSLFGHSRASLLMLGVAELVPILVEYCKVRGEAVVDVAEDPEGRLVQLVTKTEAGDLHAISIVRQDEISRHVVDEAGREAGERGCSSLTLVVAKSVCVSWKGWVENLIRDDFEVRTMSASDLYRAICSEGARLKKGASSGTVESDSAV